MCTHPTLTTLGLVLAGAVAFSPRLEPGLGSQPQSVPGRSAAGQAPSTPPAPLYRDPVYDGAADPALAWNEAERRWWIFYTNRRANVPEAQAGVAWCHGTDIGIASSPDGGRSWEYRGTAKGIEFEAGRNTFWAPAIVEHGRHYHMFISYVRGVPSDWSGDRRIVHYTSRDLVTWSFDRVLELSSARVIDAFVYPMPTGGWRMWYKDEANGSHIYAADSPDLRAWTVVGPVISGTSQEGAAVFHWRGAYWMLVDRWTGMGVLRSNDLVHWVEQPERILSAPGAREDDGDIGRHGEVVVQGRDAYIFYFTHPFGPTEHTKPGRHRSSLQVARLDTTSGRLVCDRDQAFALSLQPPSGFRPMRPPVSNLSFSSADARLAAAFDWAKRQALEYVFPAAVYDDPVGDWYEAALPGRFAFCMRDVAHQATGAHLLGLAAFNRNLLGRFAKGIAPSRDFATFWEIDKYNRPAPVDYTSDRDFWYNLPASFDVVDACWRQYLWTGDRAYLEDPAFAAFYRTTLTDCIRAWDRDGDGLPEHRRGDGRRGIGSYDEGDIDNLVLGADLIAVQRRALLSYAAMRRALGDAGSAASLEQQAAEVARIFHTRWWDESRQAYAGAMVEGGRLVWDASLDTQTLPLYFGLLTPGPRRERALDRLQAQPSRGIEEQSYRPEVYVRLGLSEAACTELLRLADPARPRREYPEVSFAVIGAIGAGLMGIEPDARGRTVVTLSRLPSRTPWAELTGIPVFDNTIELRHEGLTASQLSNLKGPGIQWTASFPGRHTRLVVDGRSVAASRGIGEDGQTRSWVVVPVGQGERHRVAVRQPRPVALLDANLESTNAQPGPVEGSRLCAASRGDSVRSQGSRPSRRR